MFHFPNLRYEQIISLYRLSLCASWFYRNETKSSLRPCPFNIIVSSNIFGISKTKPMSIFHPNSCNNWICLSCDWYWPVNCYELDFFQWKVHYIADAIFLRIRWLPRLVMVMYCVRYSVICAPGVLMSLESRCRKQWNVATQYRLHLACKWYRRMHCYNFDIFLKDEL